MKKKVLSVLSAVLAISVSGGCNVMENAKSCGFAYHGKSGVITENLENVSFVDKDEELALQFDYEGVTYSMDFPRENLQENNGQMIYYCTFSDSSNRECLGSLIITEESYGSAAGTVRFTGDIANEEAFGFIVAPNKSVLNDYIDALESGLTQLDTWSSTVQETE